MNAYSRARHGACARCALVTATLSVLAGIALLLMSNTYRAQADTTILYVNHAASGSNNGSSWSDAYTNLQTALSAASSGDEVWVARGVYTPTTTGYLSDTFLLQAGVSIYGGFAATETLLTERNWIANLTVLSGDIDSNDTTDASGVVTHTSHITGSNSYHVVTIAGNTTDSARLDGFSITAGRANGGSADNNGGGIYNVAGDAALANLRIIGNAATGNGGGMHCEGIYGNGAAPTLTSVTFEHNAAANGAGINSNYYSSPLLTDVAFIRNVAVDEGGGMRNGSDSNPQLTDVLFIENTAGGGGGFFNGWLGKPTLTRVTFERNAATGHGGGLYSYNDGSHPTIVGSSFISNTAVGKGGGLFMYYHAYVSLEDTVFAGNSAANGGGMAGVDIIYDPGSKLVNVVFYSNTATNNGGAIHNYRNLMYLYNVTLYGNTAANKGGAMYNDIIPPALANVISWGNSAASGAEISNDPSNSVPGISFSDIEGSGGSGSGWDTALGTDSGGNIDADPLFVSPATGNLRLQFTSPAIDAGKNSAVPPAITTDLDGNPRFMDVPYVTDTGSGTPPIVDMGAYEAPNYAPSFTSAPVLTATEDITYTYTITATDPDLIRGDTLSITATTLPAWLALTDHADGTAALTGVPALADVGDHAVVLKVMDGGGLSSTQPFTITVLEKYPFKLYLPVTMN